MYSRWVNWAIVLLWLAAMGWLLKCKVLPTFEVGDPPDQQEIVDLLPSEPPVGWTLAMNGRNVGWALTTISRQPEGMIKVGSHVHFDEVPLSQLTPGWLQTLLQSVDQPSMKQAMDARSVLYLNSRGRLTRFESTVGMDVADDFISLTGEVVGSQVLLAVRAGEFVYRSEAYLPNGALMGDALQPQTRLPGLRQGQTWTVPVYSPLRPPNSPMEILHAEVEDEDILPWNGRMERVWLVVYKTDPGASLLNRQEARGKLWVSREGDVLRQEVGILGSKLSFTRLPVHDAVALQQIAESKSIPETDSASIHEEVWPLDWPGAPFGSNPSPPAPAAIKP